MLLSILGNHDGSGLANLDDERAQQFAKAIADTLDKYDLLFERFLNPDRISLPDIDTDFDDDGRGRVLEWVEEKYGHENCAHIITYGTMATKNSIKDVARVEKLPLDKANYLCKLIPDKLPDGLKMNIGNAIKCIPELREAVGAE